MRMVLLFLIMSMTTAHLSASVSFARDRDCMDSLKDLFHSNGKAWHETKDGKQIFTHFIPPKKEKGAIYVLVNGLVYSTDRWDGLVKELVKKGHGVLRYDFVNQSRTLAKQEKAVFRSLADQTEDLKELIGKHRNQSKEVHLVGLSYGAAITTEFAKTHPKEISSLTLMSPIVVSTDRYQPAGVMARNAIDLYRFWGPAAYESAYENTYRGLIRNLYQESRYPDVSKAHYQDALFELGKAVRDFDLKNELRGLKEVPVRLILAGREEAAPRADILKVKEALGARDGDGFIVIQDAAHAIPDTSPEEGAKALMKGGVWK